MYQCSPSDTLVADSEKDFWMVDSGANICVTHPDDPIILQKFGIASTLRTTQGIIKAPKAVVKTPVGPRPALLVPGSGRILPEAEFGEASDGFYQWCNNTIFITKGGRNMNPRVVSRIPRIPHCEYDESVETLCLKDSNHSGLQKGESIRHFHLCSKCGAEFAHNHKVSDHSETGHTICSQCKDPVRNIKQTLAKAFHSILFENNVPGVSSNRLEVRHGVTILVPGRKALSNSYCPHT